MYSNTSNRWDILFVFQKHIYYRAFTDMNQIQEKGEQDTVHSRLYIGGFHCIFPTGMEFDLLSAVQYWFGSI